MKTVDEVVTWLNAVVTTVVSLNSFMLRKEADITNKREDKLGNISFDLKIGKLGTISLLAGECVENGVKQIKWGLVTSAAEAGLIDCTVRANPKLRAERTAQIMKNLL